MTSLSSLRVALVVPDYRYPRVDERQHQIGRLRGACRVGAIDLVVYPEAYGKASSEGSQGLVDRWAEELGVPVLAGIGTDDGFQVAAYRNPAPAPGDTATHLYVKHSSARRLAYAWPGYAGPRDPMFHPIRLKRWPIGVQICHDMFFGLVGQRLIREGARALIDLSGGGVVRRKWEDVLGGRSVELGGPVLCTMGWDGEARPNRTSRAFAYDRGRAMGPVLSTAVPDRVGGYAVVEVGEPAPTSLADDQPFSPKRYEDITVSIGTAAEADVRIRRDGTGTAVDGRCPHATVGDWRVFDTGAGRVGVLALGLSALRDGLTLYRSLPPAGAFDHHLVVYHAPDDPADPDEALALLKLRAIEHRVGAILFAGTRREVIKTDRYKHIQRLREHRGRFGLDAANLGGTRSVATAGLPPRWFPAYLGLDSG